MRLRRLLLPLLLGACVGEPSYVGRLCDPGGSCPGGLVCDRDGTCQERGRGDAGEPEDGAVDAAPDAAGRPDAGDRGDAEAPDADPPDGSDPPDAGPALTSVTVLPASIDVPAGFDAQLTATARYENDVEEDVTSQAVWSIVDPNLAAVGGDGRVVTLLPGTTIVNAAFGGMTGSAALNVDDPIVLEVSSFNKHNLAVRSDGVLFGWGYNAQRQVDATATDAVTAPARHSTLSDVAFARACGVMSVAVLKDGTSRAWGDNQGGQLGDGTFGATQVTTPVQVLGPGGAGVLSGVQDIRCGYDFVLALMPNGTVLSWGANAFGSLGLGGEMNELQPVPTPIPGLSNVIAVAAGSYHGVALHQDGTVSTWGYNDYGQLGNAAPGTHRNTPAQVGGVAGATGIDAGWGHTVAQLGDGTVLAWGWNAYGQLGDGARMDQPAPVTVQASAGVDLTGVIAVSAGFTHTVARLGDGTLRSWGNNLYVQLGSGSAEVDGPLPELVLGSAGGAPFMAHMQVVAGGDHTLVLSATREIWGWGSNENGEIGNGASGMGMVVPFPLRIMGP